ncbi:hypothetical protein BOTNAR_0507g00050 [Botryotinia narcissicola]|uniref:2EXR domain-containing protein n=1 Tax=Botryotinia narcissicola TaxID=278944 RepID=A0A4Z1HF40_9HELO|nr:hypothetical protein BOTNAR_0507g00050 [Botryotinia narcissicola]
MDPELIKLGIEAIIINRIYKAFEVSRPFRSSVGTKGKAMKTGRLASPEKRRIKTLVVDQDCDFYEIHKEMGSIIIMAYPSCIIESQTTAFSHILKRMDCIEDPEHLLYQVSVHYAFKDIYRCLRIDNANSDLLAEELEMFVRMVHSHRKQRDYADDFSNCPLIFNDQLDTEPIEGVQTSSSRSYPFTSLTVHPSPSFPLCPKTFTLFPKLPPKTRQNIWCLCAPEHGRVIELNISKDSIFPTKHPAHAIFHVNRESRSHLLSVMGYETLMLKNNRHLRIKAWSRDAIINFTHEVLFLNPPMSGIIKGYSHIDGNIPRMLLALKQATEPDQLERIKTLAISVKWIREFQVKAA